jgi:hypothetical protein
LTVMLEPSREWFTSLPAMHFTNDHIRG